MTRRRDLFKQIAGYLVCIGLFLAFIHWVLALPLHQEDWEHIFALLGIQALLVSVSSFYVWRANIKTIKKIPDHLIDFPDSAVYLLSSPTLAMLFITFPFFSALDGFGEKAVFIFSLMFLLSSLLFIATIMVDGFGLFISSKYSQAKKFKNKEQEEKQND